MVRAEGRSGGTGSPCLKYGCPGLPFLHLCFPKSKCRSVSSVRRISNRPFVSTQHSTSLPNQHYQPPPLLPLQPAAYKQQWKRFGSQATRRAAWWLLSKPELLTLPKGCHEQSHATQALLQEAVQKSFEVSHLDPDRQECCWKKKRSLINRSKSWL